MFNVPTINNCGSSRTGVGVYLGAYDEAPTARSNGRLQEGDLYHDETLRGLFVYIDGSWDRVSTTETDQASVNEVLSNIEAINSVNDNEANIEAVLANETSIKRVSGSITSVNTVAGNMSDVETVASNIDLIEDFGDVGITAFAIKETVNVSIPDTTTIVLGNAVSNLSNVVVDVFVNGLKLTPDEFTTSGTTDIDLVGLVLQPGDVVDVISEKEYDVANTYTKGEVDNRLGSMYEDNGVLFMPQGVTSDVLVPVDTNAMAIDSITIPDEYELIVADGSVFKVI